MSLSTNMYSVIFILCLLKIEAKVYTSEEETRIKSYINNMIQCKQVTGLSLAVSKNDEVFSDGFGLANVEKSKPVTRRTKMTIASISKSLTSIVWASIISEAKKKGKSGLDWDTKVKDMLNDSFELHNDCLTQMTTLEDFLSHRTGLDSGDLRFEAGILKETTREDLMTNIKYLQSRRGFREAHYYSNTGYVMVGYLLEKETKKSWEQTMQDVFFAPLDMTSTEFLTPEAFKSMATPYKYIEGRGKVELDERIYFTLDQYAPAGAIVSTADDMSKVLKWLTTGELSKLGIDKDVFDGLFEQKIFMSPYYRHRYSLAYSIPSSVDTYGYGNGWMLSKFRGEDMYFHTGGWYGYTAIMAFIPSKRIGVFLNSNGIGESGFPYIMLPTAFYLLDTLLGVEPWINETTACTYPLPWDERVVRKSTEMGDQVNVDKADRFVGNFSNKFHGDFSVIKVNNILTVKYGLLLTGILSYKSDAVFRMKVVGTLAGVVKTNIKVEFSNLQNNVYMSVTVDRRAVFDRITTSINMSTQLGYTSVMYFVIFLWYITQ